MRKPFLVLLRFIFLALLLTGCAQEENLIHHKASRERPQRQSKRFDEALELPNFIFSLQKLTGGKGQITTFTNARSALEEQYDFAIVENAPVKILIFPDGTIKYILLIEREVKEELVFENLILTFKNENVTAYLIKYYLSEEPEKVEGHQSYTIEVVDKQVTDLEVDGKQHFMGAGCWDIVTTYCCDRGECNCWPAIHIAQAACYVQQNCMFDVVTTMCPQGSGDWGPIPGGTAGGSAGGTGGGTPPGSTGSGNEGSAEVDPGAVPNHSEEVEIVMPDEEITTGTNIPCDELKNLLRQAIQM